jgi:hypothetical protein
MVGSESASCLQNLLDAAFKEVLGVMLREGASSGLI